MDRYLTGLEEELEICSVIALGGTLQYIANDRVGTMGDREGAVKRLTFGIVLSSAKLV